MAAKPPRKRIVPQQVQAPASPPGPEVASLVALQVTDLQQQAELAPQLLGPGRKIWVDLKEYQGKEVDWKKILKERGVKPQQPGKAAVSLQLPGGPTVDGEPVAPSLATLGQPRSKFATNPLAKVIARLERAYCAKGGDSDEEDSGSEKQGDADEAEASGDESDGTDNEGATDKEEQRGGDGAEGEAGGGGGGGKSGAEDKPAGVKKSATRGDHYDYNDDFIDDEEILTYITTKKQKTKHQGFFISKGELEVEESQEEDGSGADDEGTEGEEERARRKAEKKAAKKQRRQQQQQQQGAVDGTSAEHASVEDDEFTKPGEGSKPAARRGEGKKRKAWEGEGQQEEQADGAVKPKKKKPKAKPTGMTEAASGVASHAATGGIAQLALAAVKGAAKPNAGSAPASPTAAPRSAKVSPPSSATKKPRTAGEAYEPAPDILQAIQHIRETASSCPPPAAAAAAPAGEGGGTSGGAGAEESSRSKKLPPQVLQAVRRLAPLFQRERKRHSGAQREICRVLMEFLEPFTTEANLKLHLNKPSESGAVKSATASLAALKKAAQEHYKDAPAAPALGESNTDDDFQASPNLASQRQQTPAAAGAANGGGGSSEGPGSQLGAVPTKIRRHIYKFMSAKLQDKKLSSEYGKAVVQEVVAQLPPGAVDAQRVQQIFEEQKKVAEKRRRDQEAKLQQQQSQELPPAQQQGQPQQQGQQARQEPTVAQQQQAPVQQQQSQQAMTTVEQSGQQQQQQQQQLKPPAAALLPAAAEPAVAGPTAGGVAALAAQRGATAAAAAKQVAAVPKPPPAGKAADKTGGAAGDRHTKKAKGMARHHMFSDDPQLFAEMAIKKAAEVAAAGRAAQPVAAAAKPQQHRQQALQQELPPPPLLRIVSVPVVSPGSAQPAAEPVQQGLVAAPAALHAAAPAPAANELSGRGSQGPAAVTAPALEPAQVEAALQLGSGSLPTAGSLPAPPPPPVPVPRYTDEQLVQAAVKAGAQEGTVRELLAKVINTGRKWDARIVRVLLLHGSQGLTPKAAQDKATELGFVSLEEKIRWQSQKQMRSVGVIAHVGRSQYALRCFPGVEDTPTRAEEKDAAKEDVKVEPAPA